MNINQGRSPQKMEGNYKTAGYALLGFVVVIIFSILFSLI